MNNSEFNISVIIPCFNTERYLPFAIESALKQTLVPKEIIIVDDGSTDNSFAAASAFTAAQVRVIPGSHQGIAVTRNIGIRHATGDYLAFLDADDVWDTEKLEKQCLILREQLSVHGVFGKLQQFISPDMPDEEKKRYVFSSEPQDGYLAGCFLIKRKDFLQVGLFNELLKAGEFIEWYIRAKQKNMIFAMTDQVVMYRRIHGNNTVLSDRAALHADYLKIIRMKLQNNTQSESMLDK